MSNAQAKCRRCGYRSKNRAFFRREKAGIFRRRKTEAASYIVPWVAVVVGVLILAVGPEGLEATILACACLGIGALLLGIFVTIAVHELGHAAVARLVGMTVASITLGTGPLLIAYRGKTTVLAARTFLLTGGMTQVYYKDVRPAKWRSALMLLGGIGANCAIAALGILHLVAWYRSGRSIHPVTAFVTVSALLSQITVVPYNVFGGNLRIGQARLPSDGKRLVDLMKSRDFDERELRQRYLLEGGQLLAGSDPDATLRHFETACRVFPASGLFLTMLILCVGKVRGARAAVRCHLDRTATFDATGERDKPGVARAYMLVAWYALLTGDPELLPLADRLSQQAVATLPDVARGTRVAVMMRLGEPDAGKPVLVEALRRNVTKSDKAEIACFLAGIERDQDNVVLADELERFARYHLADPSRVEISRFGGRGRRRRGMDGSAIDPRS